MTIVDSAASAARYIRRVFAAPDIDADGWYARGTEPLPIAAPKYDPTWADDIPSADLSAIGREIERRRACERLGVAQPCARWARASEHEAHVWDHNGTVAQCPGWRGEP